MVCLGYSPGTAGWMAQINPLCYSGPKSLYLSGCSFLSFSSLSLSYFLFHDNSCLISIFLFYPSFLHLLIPLLCYLSHSKREIVAKTLEEKF